MTKAQIFIAGIVGADVTLQDVMRQLKSYQNYTSVEVYIDTPGGSVDEGMAIYNYISKIGNVTTIAKRAWSIGSIIFMAGDKRVVENTNDPILIHNPWGTISGNSIDFSNMASHLKKIEDDFVQFYANIINADEDSIRRLLDKETFLSAEEAVALGFATEIMEPLKAVAFIPTNKKKENTNFMNDFIKALKKLIDTQQPKALVLQDATGVEITFPDVAEDAEPQIGDSAQVDGRPAEGEYLSPEGDTWVFEAGILTEVRSATVVEEEEISTEEVEALIQKIMDKTKAETLAQAKEERELAIAALTEEYSKKIQETEAEVLALKKLIGSEELNITKVETNTNPRQTKSLAEIMKNRK